VIYGIGTDVVQLARVEEIYARHGEHFVRRLLMPQEETAFRSYRRPVRFLAMRSPPRRRSSRRWARDSRTASGSATSASRPTPGVGRRSFGRSGAARGATSSARARAT